LTGNDWVAVFTAGNGANIGGKVLAAFAEDCRAKYMDFGSLDDLADGRGFDLRKIESAAKAADRLAEIEYLAGIIFVIDDDLTVNSVDEVSELLRGLFVVLKTFLKSPAKKFATLIHIGEQADGIGTVVYEGILGMFLSLAHEYPSILFRAVQMDEQIGFSAVVDVALDRNQPLLEAVFRNGKILTREWQPALSSFNHVSLPIIAPGHAVVFSGGADGITYCLARSLAPLGCRLVFLGRTTLDPEIDYLRLLSEVTPQDNLQTASVRKAIDTFRNVEDLRAAGVDASYYSCDVTNAAETESVIAQILQRYGRIDGIVHGAGILRDTFAEQMTPEDFCAVVDVKLRGAWNLYSAANNAGLKFFVCLSSVAAILGNPGQVNYTAANRAMSKLVAQFQLQTPSLICKSLMLPPIEGTGMAETPEIREKMKRANAGYVHVDELAALFDREVVMGTEDAWVLFMSSLPHVPTILLDSSTLPSPNPAMVSGTLQFPKEQFPMIDSIDKVDLLTGELHATRVFSLEKDIWLTDHKPFKFVRHQMVSAIMVIEAFMEAARLLYPHLPVCAIREAEFLDILECPPGIGRYSKIFCRRIPSSPGEIVCEASLASREISPTGRVTDRTSLNHKAQVVLGAEIKLPSVDSGTFPIRKEELDGSPMSHETVMKFYLNSLHKGRYRVIDTIDGIGPDTVRGRLVYRESEDFAAPMQTRYQYSPYLLEALLQLCGNFYIEVRRDHERGRAMAEAKPIKGHKSAKSEGQKSSRGSRLVRDRRSAATGRSESRNERPSNDFGKVIPYRIGEIGFSRKCAHGESVMLECRMTSRDDEGFVWTARGVDDSGQTLMWVRDLVLRWVSS
jgi:NAD(P)-dependent dehydrogenase (short-subunit alcohol dehydrogenase family)